jgi:hypothetical protein
VSRAISVSVVGDANIDNQIATAGRVRQVVDDLDISALQTRARGNPLIGWRVTLRCVGMNVGVVFSWEDVVWEGAVWLCPR